MSDAALFDIAPTLPIPPESERPRVARDLILSRSEIGPARLCVAVWHSRLPATQRGPWRLAFTAEHGGYLYGAALWHNPSARGLPNEWLELRRLAIPDYAPPHSASWMLGAMRKWIRREMPEVPRLLSYQDTDVHTGTIYKAAGWSPAYYSKPRVRDRTPPRVGTNRAYRSDLNGQAPAAAGKIRWEITP